MMTKFPSDMAEVFPAAVRRDSLQNPGGWISGQKAWIGQITSPKNMKEL
jgi:hypothetical protein